jgi:FkbM family methyltransferase
MRHEEFLEAYLPTKRQGTAINVGGGEGDWIARFVPLFSNVIAIEANPAAADRLREKFDGPPVGNVSILDGAGWITSAAKLAFNVRANEPRQSALACRDVRRDSGVSEVIEVATIAIDDIPKAGCDLIWVDVEGAELQVMQGATRTIEAHRPMIVVECHEVENRDWLIRWLTRAGYNLAIVHNPAHDLKDSRWDQNTHLIGYHWRYRGNW